MRVKSPLSAKGAAKATLGLLGPDEIRLVVATDGIHLVFHECNQRTDHKRHAIQHQRRQLIAHGFPSPRRHDHKCVTAVQDALDGKLLLTLEFVESKKMLERLRGRQF